jgi:phosphoenolpyruvate---glycerone phosphotransferase subunit DhaL
MADGMIASSDVVAAMGRVSTALDAQHEYLTDLDAAMGDGDLGITVCKIAKALTDYANGGAPADDLGKYIAALGMAINKVAPSTLGTILATGLLRAGKEARGISQLDGARLATMLTAANAGIQEKGGARPGDKTVVDALHPAAETFAAAIAAGESLSAAAEKLLAAAEAGRDAVTAQRSKIGRASWVGERTEGKVDPGCAALVIIFEAILGKK